MTFRALFFAALLTMLPANAQASQAAFRPADSARSAHKAGRFTEAYAMLRPALSACPPGEAESVDCLELMALAGRWAVDAGALPDGEAFARRALSGSLRPATRDSMGAARAMATLAYVLSATGQRGAESLYTKAIALQRGLDARPDLAFSLAGLAALQMRAGNYLAAEAHAREAAALMEATASNSLGAVRNRVVLGTALSAQRRFADAHGVLAPACTTIDTRLGTHALNADCSASLAYVLVELGRLADSEALYRRAVRIDNALYGESSTRAADSINSLATALFALGKVQDAELLFRQALRIRTAEFGEADARTLDSINNVAAALDAQGRHVDAEPLYRRALDLRIRTFGENHADVAAAYANLGINLRNQRNLALAEQLLRRALQIDQAVHGDHPATAASYGQLARTLDEQDRFAEAEPYHRRALTIHRVHSGENAVRTGTAFSNLGYNLHRQGRSAEAVPALREALSRYRAILGEDHPETAKTYKNLGLSLEAIGDNQGAERAYRTGLAIQQKLLDRLHPDMLVSRRAFGLFAMRTRDMPREALLQFRRATSALLDRAQDAGRDARADTELRHYRALFAFRVEAAWRVAHLHRK